MSKKRLGRILDSILAVIMIFIMAGAIAYAQLQPEKIAEGVEAVKTEPLKEAMALQGPERYMDLFKANIEDLDSAMDSLDIVSEALDAGDTELAKMELQNAKELLLPVRDSMDEYVTDMGPAVNSRCPISGKRIDPKNVPQELTRMYKGQKVGFCSAMCPPTWDKLSDTERDTKLMEIMPQKNFEEIFEETKEKLEKEALEEIPKDIPSY